MTLRDAVSISHEPQKFVGRCIPMSAQVPETPPAGRAARMVYALQRSAATPAAWAAAAQLATTTS
jgi:hypothetical protein